jgi:hypothetical protein
MDCIELQGLMLACLVKYLQGSIKLQVALPGHTKTLCSITAAREPPNWPAGMLFGGIHISRPSPFSHVSGIACPALAEAKALSSRQTVGPASLRASPT